MQLRNPTRHQPPTANRQSLSANQQAIANRLPDYTYSVPGMLGYFLDPGHTAGGYRLHERCYFDQKDLEVDMHGKVRDGAVCDVTVWLF